MVYNRTIRRFIADDNVVYQWLRRRYDWLQTTAEHDIIWSMWAGDHGQLFFGIHLNREWQFHGKSNELIDAFLACPPDWTQGPSLLRDKHGLPLPGCMTIVPVLWLLFSKLSMLPSYQHLSGNSLSSIRAPYCFDTSSCEIFMILFNFCWYLGLDNFPR